MWRSLSVCDSPINSRYLAHSFTVDAANRKQKGTDFMHEFAKKQKLLEINPKSPLIEGLLRRIENLPTEEEGRDFEAEEELKEVATILIDGALVRSGFEVPDSNE